MWVAFFSHHVARQQKNKNLWLLGFFLVCARDVKDKCTGGYDHKLEANVKTLCQSVTIGYFAKNEKKHKFLNWIELS